MAVPDASSPVAAIHITDIEAAINFWRARHPSPDGVAIASELAALAEVYAVLVYRHASEIDDAALSPAAADAWHAWYQTTPDTPCIAICSTAQGDEICKGCGRTFDEVQHWPAMTPSAKRQVWRRITEIGQAWRFNRYAERGVRLVGRWG
jgi:uncharacterized protein